MQKNLKQVDLQSMRIKKNVVKKLAENSNNLFANLISNNVLLIYSKQNDQLKNINNITNCLKQLNKKHFFLIGALINQQYYRPSEFAKYFLTRTFEENLKREQYLLAKTIFLKTAGLKKHLSLKKF